ncbi:hypothetical protein [Roseibium sediminis]|uniref:hypothetical protein n=1 Tax=Roseibium sediminis TaxID=1775174 RepID=UPI00123DCDC4|nr:hypothetical protein [Roseibium sediminis]
MSYKTCIVCFPFAMVAVSWLIAFFHATPDDTHQVQTSDNPFSQVKKLRAARMMHFRKDGFWYRRKAVTHEGAEMTFKVEERV